MPSLGDLPFEERMMKMNQFFGPQGSHKNDFVKVVEQTVVKDRDHISEMLKEVEDEGGEGLMLRKPKS
jgi:DNA ligase-1